MNYGTRALLLSLGESGRWVHVADAIESLRRGDEPRARIEVRVAHVLSRLQSEELVERKRGLYRLVARELPSRGLEASAKVEAQLRLALQVCAMLRTKVLEHERILGLDNPQHLHRYTFPVRRVDLDVRE